MALRRSSEGLLDGRAEELEGREVPVRRVELVPLRVRVVVVRVAGDERVARGLEDALGGGAAGDLGGVDGVVEEEN